LKKSFVCLVLSSFVLAGTSFNADAKRLGGSKSMGKQSQSVTQKQQAAPAQPAAPAVAPAPAAKPAPAAPAAQPKKGFGMAGILGGLAAGLGLGWLLSHFGLGEAAASFFMGLLVVLLVVMVGAWLFRRFSGNQATYIQALLEGQHGMLIIVLIDKNLHRLVQLPLVLLQHLLKSILLLKTLIKSPS